VTRRTFKKLLLSLIAIGALGSLTTGGVYAVFTTDTTNTTSIVGSAIFTMSNTVGPTGTPCGSQSGTGNSNLSCDAVVTSSTLNLPGALTKVKVTITNAGTTPVYDLAVSMPGATAGAGCVKTDITNVGAVHGGGDPCSSATSDLFYLQETQSDFTTPIKCWYPTAAGTTCSMASSPTLNLFANTYYYDPGVNVASKLDLGTDGSSRYGPGAGQSRYFVVGIQEGADNSLQGEMATFSLLWHMDSAA
jgi:hypothetical protein